MIFSNNKYIYYDEVSSMPKLQIFSLFNIVIFFKNNEILTDVLILETVTTQHGIILSSAIRSSLRSLEIETEIIYLI